MDYRPPSGGQALSEADSEGAFTAHLSKGLVSGRKNEPYVVSGLVAVLKAEGRDVQLVSGARDEDGEDQIILIDGERLVVQVVTMPAEGRVWQPLNTLGTFTETADREKAVDWGRSALLKKRDAKETIVVLDAHHIGALVGRRLVEAYLAVHPKPIDEFGFKDAWIIGPTPPFSARIA